MILAEMYVVISVLNKQPFVLMITWFILRFIMRRNPLTAELLVSEIQGALSSLCFMHGCLPSAHTPTDFV